MRLRILAGVLIVLAIVLIANWLQSQNAAPVGPAPVPPPGKEARPAVEFRQLPDGIVEDLSAEYMEGYGDLDSPPMRDLVLLRDVLGAFSYTVKVPEALPTAGNREIVTALVGENPYKIRFIDPGSEFLNDSGELVDRWKTPIFFHFVDAMNPGIRSAGPDLEMWTADDLIAEE